jgi:photosystem II stability/assembly factor-like uncharacterized protein
MPDAATASAGIVMSPQVARAVQGGSVQFTAAATGIADRTVKWSVQEGSTGGSVDANGRYTAPSTTGKYHVVASSVSNTSLTAAAEVTVTAPQGQPPTLTPGVWLDITPSIAGFSSTFGATAIEVSPVDPRTIYVSLDANGLWRTTDGGSNWAVVGDRAKAPKGGETTISYLDSPVRVEVDPGDPNHLYATEGVRGSAMGFWVSRDAGATWTKPKGFIDISAKTTNDITALAVAQGDFKHILLGSHSGWPGQNTAGILESKDGGDTWIAHPAPAGWPTGSLGIDFLYDPASGQGAPNIWLVTTDGAGFWRTQDGGTTWKQVSTENTAHGGAQIYYAANGTLYSGASHFPVFSKDNGQTWQGLNNSGLPNWYYYIVCGDGKTLYTQGSYASMAAREDYFWSASESSGTTWAKYSNQTFTNGPAMMRFDAANRIMYTVNWGAGVWALKVKD